MSRRWAARPSSSRPTPPIPSARGAGEQARGGVRADRHLGERRLHHGLLAGHGDHARRVQARHRGDVSRLRLRHPGRAEPHAARATAAPSSRSARRWPTAASRSRRRTAARSTPSRASPSRCARELIHNKSHVQLTMVQLPAVNTPQFTWGRNKMPRKAQPVPPIYQPELIAEAIYWAAHHKQAPDVHRRLDGHRHHRQQVLPRSWRLVSGPDRLRQPDARPAARPRPAEQPLPAGGHHARTTARTAPSTTRPSITATRCGRPSTRG